MSSSYSVVNTGEMHSSKIQVKRRHRESPGVTGPLADQLCAGRSQS